MRKNLIKELQKVFPDYIIERKEMCLVINDVYCGDYEIQEDDINGFFVGNAWEEIQKIIPMIVEDGILYDPEKHICVGRNWRSNNVQV